VDDGGDDDDDGDATQAYQPPELDPSTSYAVAAVTQQQRNAYNPF
jgi:hypothetical protein